VQSLNNNLEQEVETRTIELREKVREIQRLYEMKTVFLQAVSHESSHFDYGISDVIKKFPVSANRKSNYLASNARSGGA
jgi:nitrate/nitrite-specific signal transduction histidine kinase